MAETIWEKQRDNKIYNPPTTSSWYFLGRPQKTAPLVRTALDRSPHEEGPKKRTFIFHSQCKNFTIMKRVFTLFCSIVFAAVVHAQEPVAAAKGVTYGAGTTAEGYISVNDLEKKMTDKKFEGKVSGKVVEVCQEKGCWMKLERANGEPLMVKFKDYGFFMPKNIVGKEVVIEGTASIKETSVKQLRHYAQDAGKSKEEIEKIKKPKKDVQFVASGVLVL
jgi:hypothetical protein